MNEWISVQDRLPAKDDHTEYLITDGEHCFVGSYRHKAKAWDSHILGWIQMQSGGKWVDVEITHWMPLPEPPKESDTK